MKKIQTEKIGLFARKYIFDIAIASLFVLFALLLAERPKVDYITLPSVPSPQRRGTNERNIPSPLVGEGEGKGYFRGKDRKTLPAVSGEVSADQATEKDALPAKERYKDLAKRNIFEADGSYERPKGLIVLPENPYNLIAVLEGKEKRAIFREYTGDMVSFKKGEKMIDGSVIMEIGRMDVKVKKGKNIREYRIFDVKKKEAIRSKQ
jgi:hypothetical protein